MLEFIKLLFEFKKINHLNKNINYKKDARNGDRTHAHIRELDLKSNALTTRPSGLSKQNKDSLILDLLYLFSGRN